MIVDEFTGRMMPGRRWSDGLHQAVEAKEGVKIERENQTLATITFQNYFRMYKKLSGMTGTADTEASEFGQIYKLDVTVIPTNRDMIRDDRGDLVYRTAQEKWNAVVEEIRECAAAGASRCWSARSRSRRARCSRSCSTGRRKVPHVVLNAKYHEREASIVAQAGRKGAVTIATNMAGRGTDILLGGNPEGLATLRGRSGDRARGVPGGLRALPARPAPREREEVLAARRPAHPRHRAPRVAAHRQPAPRPLRPPGRPRLLALLPLARGRPDADLRLRPHPGPDGAPRHGRGRGDRARDGHARPSSAPRSRSRGGTSRPASTCSSTTT